MRSPAKGHPDVWMPMFLMSDTPFFHQGQRVLEKLWMTGITGTSVCTVFNGLTATDGFVVVWKCYDESCNFILLSSCGMLRCRRPSGDLASSHKGTWSLHDEAARGGATLRASDEWVQPCAWTDCTTTEIGSKSWKTWLENGLERS